MSKQEFNEQDYEAMRASLLAEAQSPAQVLEITREYPSLQTLKAQTGKETR